jgi:probable rRNA maturation factor
MSLTHIALSFTNTTTYKRLPYKKMQSVIEHIVQGERIARRRLGEISIIFMDNAELRAINKEFLQHDYDTDIITFPLDDTRIDGELYISVDMAIDNARHYGVSRSNELVRLVAHGMLHLIGYNDTTDAERTLMQAKENEYLATVYAVRSL